MVSSVKFLPKAVAIQKISENLEISTDSTEEGKNLFELFSKIQLFDGDEKGYSINKVKKS